MVADNSQSMSVSWSPYGKILTNTKAGGASLAFGYNAMQQRVLKRVVLAGDTTRTYYIRDAQGNTMGVYTRHNDSVTWREQYIFGSSRLGLYRADTLVNKGLQVISKLYEGKRNYELTNHLGNVMAVINDRKTDSLSATNVKLGFNAVVISATDYYPFGMSIDSRSYTSSLYRYTFNGKENDKETGEQDYGMRIYDPRIAKFLSVDPIADKYPWYTPYQFAGNSPIMAIDLDGLEPAKPDQNEYKNKTGGIDSPFKWTGGDEKFLKGVSTWSLGQQLTENKVDKSKFLENKSTDIMKRYVNINTQFILKNEDKLGTEKDLVNRLLGDFIYGTGPENIVFPHNGKVSNLLKNSIAVVESMDKWVTKYHAESGKVIGWAMDVRGQANVGMKEGILSLENFLGSVATRFTIIKSEDVKDGQKLTVKVEIFNVTSFTSGNISKDVPLINKFYDNPASTPRNSESYSKNRKNKTYSNISQYFSFDTEITLPKKKLP